MAFQLTLSKKTLPASEALKRKKVVTVQDGTATLGPGDAICPIPDYPLAQALRITQEAGGYFLHSQPGTQLNLSECTTQPHPLHSGDTLTVGDWNVQFHVCHAKVGQSWKSSILAILSQLAICVIILAVLLSMFWLPRVLSSRDSWGGQAAIEELSIALDAARGKLRRIEQEKELDPFRKLLLEHVSEELSERVRHVRSYGRRLTLQQRQDMLADVDKLMQVLQQCLDNPSLDALPPPAIDQAATKIIRDRLKGLGGASDFQLKEKVKP